MRHTGIYVLLFCFLFLASGQVYGQKEVNVWYFGERAGLEFKNGIPSPLTNSLMNTAEGSATMADSEGRLLFYTNGVYVWNREHKVMPNGFRLMGHSSSTQSALIVPHPGKPGQYYLFTTDVQSQAYGLRYSLVDMSLEKGLGNITEKNIFLTSPITEKITAVRHQNQRDVWVVVHKWNSDAFDTFLITDKGVSKKPVTTNIGTVHRGKSKASIGCMKASPDGTKIALAIWRDLNRFEVFDFDAATGKLSNRLSLESYPEAYGVEFSPDGSKLYGSTNGLGGEKAQLWQFNLRAGSRSAIANTAIQIPTADNKLGALQLGPDGKIYLAVEGASYLGVIHNPNAPGWSCRFVDQGVSLGNRKGKLGLPSFIQSYFNNLGSALSPTLPDARSAVNRARN